MGFFSKIKKNTGSLVIGFLDEGICAASIKRSATALPVVEMLAFYPMETPPSVAQLEKIGKDLHAEDYVCATLLNTREYQLLTVEAPNVPPDELKTAMRWRLKDMLDFHIDDATIDVMDIPGDSNTPGRNRSMYAVAARNQIVEQRQVLFAGAKIPLSIIDIPEMAQRNIAQLLETEGRGIAFLSFGAHGGLLTVTFAGELYLSRHIDVSVSQLEQADESQKNDWLDRVTLELQRSLDHFDRQFHFITVSRLVLGPMGQAGASLQQYLASNLYLPVEQMALDAVLDISRTPELEKPESQQRYFFTLGAALRLEEKAL
ncbi:agglutinin biogenesis protein MshI [Janthinobacterium sp. 17J80-10]|uniref:type IV pilus biogenesis protein PilM n=1 Tax=Janthinobacterium sp. 17J80-10 TaxID=2497863 RepID=UPI0010057E06|nr:agglutinin biogenesis protein MshI [Janthinobacterium sp. 17J80-10]QAU34278.1 agglutinin biogenesis protein MshI [Janthinobacterium sp. 17J80-10]